MKSDAFKNDGLHQPITEKSSSKLKFTLSREKSVELWLKGKDEWNLWMKNHPDTYVDFNHVNFTPDSLASVAPDEDLAIYGKHHRYLKTISFEGYIFNGGADFTGANFPSPTHFDDARFEGEAKFTGAKFGGEASFTNTILTHMPISQMLYLAALLLLLLHTSLQTLILTQPHLNAWLISLRQHSI
ncbi:MAG: pentapeptide repeat-containing protein [Colwellia sp.]